MIWRGLITAVAAFLVLLGATERGDAAETSIASSTTVANAVLLPYKSRIETLAGITLNVRSIGSGNSVLSLHRGEADVAAVSAPLAEVVRKLNTKNPGAVDGRKLQAHDIGKTSVAFIVHPSNPVKELTFEQITDILAGRIKFWSQLGGPNMEIEIIAEPQGGGIRTMVEKTIGEWGDVLAVSKFVQSGNQVVFAVSQLPNAIGIAASAAVNNSVFPLRSDRIIEQPMFLVTRGKPTAVQEKLIEAVRSILTRDNAGS
ncbi:MAG: substrate-binding domain-containing protein [Kiloniellales bacterium]|nr:substrate-binding domain-containing protein [Kiloniellales bacterium]